MTVLVDRQMSLLISLLAPYVTTDDTFRIVPFDGRTANTASITALRQLLLDSAAEAIIVRSTTKVGEALLHDTSVRFVASGTAGEDHIDAHYLHERDIVFASAKGCNANAVADYVMLAIEAWFKKRSSRPIQGGSPTLGIVGYGNVGKKLERHAHTEGMRTLLCDPPLARLDKAKAFVSLDALLAASDIVSLHVPLTRDGEFPTAEMLTAQRLNLIKPGSLFINTSRGGIVDEQTLKQRLETHDLDAVLDVYNNEPSIDIQLMNNTLISTPHVAGYSIEAQRNIAENVGTTFLRWLGLGTFAFYEALAMTGDRGTSVRNLETDSLHTRMVLNNCVSVEQAFDELRSTYVLGHESR